jgi:hypothetical protein
MMKKLIPLTLVLFLLIIASVGPIRAQQGISAFSTANVRFPTELIFNLTAESTVDITQIFLRYRINKITTVKVTSVVQPEFDPAPFVETSWTWKMKRMLGSLPPGTEVQYSWRIQDATGDELETDWETVQFNDQRYPWDSLTEGDITLFWYEGGMSFAQVLLDSANEALEMLARDAGIYLEQAVAVYIYASSADLRDSMLYPQEWVGGIAFPQYGIVAIGVGTSNLAWGKRAIAHELAHLVTYQMTSNPYSDIPTWLDEGLSLYAEGDLRFDIKSSLDAAIFEDNLISVQSISSSFPSDTEEAMLSYAESYSIVELLLQQYDGEKMLHLLNVFKQGSSYDDALLEVYGFDTAGLDNLWRLSLGLEPRQSPSATLPQDTATPEPSTGLFGCQATSGATSQSNLIGFAVLGFLLIPGTAEIIRLRAQRGRKR